MRCHRIRRELLWLARFGEFGPSSQPHLDHLAGCSTCRDEVGYDREMVRQLRIALAARIEGIDPSASAWEGILRRAQAPEPGRLTALLHGLGLIASRLRTTTAMAGTGLALVLALNMEVVPAGVPAPEPAAEAEAPALEQVPRMPTGRTTLVALARQQGPAVSAERPDPEALMTHVEARMTPPPSSDGEVEEATEEASSTDLRVVVPADAAGEVPAGAPGSVDAGTPARAPVPFEPGLPS